MRVLLSLLCTSAAVLAAQAIVLAQTVSPQDDPGNLIVSSGTAIVVALIGSVGTVFAAGLGSWVAVRIQIASMRATCDERSDAMCHTLDRHEAEIAKLRDNK